MSMTVCSLTLPRYVSPCKHLKKKYYQNEVLITSPHPVEVSNLKCCICMFHFPNLRWSWSPQRFCKKSCSNWRFAIKNFVAKLRLGLARCIHAMELQFKEWIIHNGYIQQQPNDKGIHTWCCIVLFSKRIYMGEAKSIVSLHLPTGRHKIIKE